MKKKKSVPCEREMILEKMRLFLDRHWVLDAIVHLLVVSCVGVLIFTLCVAHFKLSVTMLLFINLFALFMYCWVNYIRPLTASRETYWSILFDVMRWLQGGTMVLWVTVGLYGKRGKSLFPPLWKLPGKEAFEVLIIGVGFFLLWNVLYYLARKYDWEWKKPLAKYGKSQLKKMKKTRKR